MSRRSQSRATRTVFNPGAVPVEHLEAITVGREAELEVIDQSLRAAATTSARPHLLVVGPRGSGKTHLFALAAHRARTDPELAEQLAVAWLPEDAYAITSYRELLRSVVETLAVGDHRGLTPTETALLSIDELGLEGLLLDALGDRVLLLMIENLDRHMQLLGPRGQRQLRGFLHEHQCAVVLASAPALFLGVSDYEAPFYGSFRVIHLGELTVDEGRQLLLRIARLDGDEELAVYLASDTGRRRLAAIADLAGGSPRLWQLLAACMDVAALDELVPLFLKLLDELTPYYKARLDELSPARAKLIHHLCRSPSGASGWRPVGARTVKQLAEAAGMSQQSASKQLSELELARFVRGRKAASGDKRATFYEISEPLLRHCLELKESRGTPLELIVTVLRDWHDTTDLRNAFLGAGPHAEAERYLGAALSRSTAIELNCSGDPNDLLLAAKAWFAAHGADGSENVAGLVRCELAAVLAEAAVVAAYEGTDIARAIALKRLTRPTTAGLEEPARRCLEATLTRLADVEPIGREAPWVDTVPRVTEGLLAAAAATTAEHECLGVRDVAEIGLLAATWLASIEREAEALPLLERIDLATEPLSVADPLRLAVLAAIAFARSHTGRMEDAIALGEQVLEQRIRTLGPDHVDTLTSRYNATLLRKVDPAKRAALLGDLLADGTRALGLVHPEVLVIRNAHAVTLSEAGQPVTARDLLADLIDDTSQVRGPRHPSTLIARSNHAAAVHDAGDPLLACALFAQLVADHIEARGPSHRRTLARRWDYARCVADAGDPARAFALFEDLSRSDVGSLMHAVRVLADAVDIDPASARSYLAEVLGRPAKDALVVIVAIAVSPELKGRLDSWLIAVLRDLGLAAMLCPSLLTAIRSAPAFGEPSRAILRRWLTLLGDQPDEPYALATRMLRAADALLDGDDTLLLGLPDEERRMVEYVGGKVNLLDEAEAEPD